MKLLGTHHITAIAGDPQRNLDFYRKVLGLRFVKRTVNFDDPSTYHLYFGDRTGKPGTILTFFPWPGARRGTRGNSQVVATSFAIPQGSLNYWSDRLKEHSITVENILRFDEQGLRFTDPDGLLLELIASDENHNATLPSPQSSPSGRGGREAPGEGEFAIRGFHAPTLQLPDSAPTKKLLTETLGFQQIAEKGSWRRFSLGARSTSAQVDLVERPDDPHGHIAVGTVHHMAFRAANDEEQLAGREKFVVWGLAFTRVFEDGYFPHLYFIDGNGIVFEIAN